MKRFFALAALVLGLAACQTEPEGLNVNVDGEQLVTVNVTVPEAETRAGANNSALGVFDNGVLGTADDNTTMRYILQVYLKNGEQFVQSDERLVEYSDGKTVNFEVRLVPGRDYQFVVWADVVTNGKQDIDNHYVTMDADKKSTLGNITLLGEWNAMDESRDAFTATELIKEYSGTKSIEIKLYRPFAKLRVVTTDIESLNNLGIVPTKATVTYSEKHYNAFNAFAGKAIADTKNRNIKHENFTIASYGENVAEGADMTLFTDYFFAENDVTQFTLEVFDQNGKLIKKNDFVTDIYVKRNYLTTIKGNILTDGKSFDVTIEDAFAGELGTEDGKTFANVDTAEELLEAINKGVENITVEDDIDLNDLLIAGTLATRASEPALVVAAENTMTIDLNGYTISQTKTQTAAHSMITNKGILTILDSKGNGKISYKDEGNGGNYVSNTIQNSGILTIEGGIIENNSVEAVATNGFPHPIDNSGKLVINGGTFTNNANYSSMRIWCTTDDDTEVIINGGTFNGCIDLHNVSNSANKGTLTINDGTFNADTYTKSAVRLLGFGTDVDEIFGYINGGTFNAKIKLNNYVGGEFNAQVFFIKGGTFAEDPSEFVNDDYTVVETENGLWTVERKPDVAKIGEVGYTSLQKAFKAAQNGDTVLFVADVEQEDGVIITDKNITIDLNGNTFTVSNGASTNNRNFKVNGSSVVTIKNGNMVAAGNYSSGAYGTLRTEGTANVTLEGVKLYNYRGNGLNVKALSGTTVTINDTEIYSQYGGGIESAGGIIELTNVKVEQKGMYTAPYNSMAISVNSGGTVTVNSGTYSTECITAEEANNQGTSHGPWCAGVLNSGGTLIIKDGTFSNDNFGENTLATYARGLLLADTGANIQIQGGTFNAVKKIVDIQNNLGDASRNPSATISGGNFSSDPLTWDGLIKVAAGYKVVEDNGIWTVVVDPAAKIGETEYASLQEAFNVGGEITLLRDITIAETVVLAEGKTVVLNLNGKTLAAVDKNTIKNNGGNLTLKNGTVTRTGDVVGYSVNNASGEINVVDATVERGLYTSGSKMTATNANISHEQSSRHAIYAWDCEVTINSGIFHNDNAGNATLMASGSSVVTINGGTFSIADGRSALGWTSSMIDQNSTAQVIVKGGLFNGGFRINSANTTLTIEGGEFNTNNGSSFTDYSGTKVVKGGKFTDTGAQNWAKKYIAEGYEMNANGEVVAK